MAANIDRTRLQIYSMDHGLQVIRMQKKNSRRIRRCCMLYQARPQNKIQLIFSVWLWLFMLDLPQMQTRLKEEQGKVKGYFVLKIVTYS